MAERDCGASSRADHSSDSTEAVLNNLVSMLQDTVNRLEALGQTSTGSQPTTTTVSVVQPSATLTAPQVFATNIHSLRSERTTPVPSNFSWNPGSSSSQAFSGKKRKSKESGEIQSRHPKRKKVATWTHTFVCLANKQQDIVPDGNERAKLQLAGLGEKKISMYANADSQDVNQELLFTFPKLAQSGGFELLRVSEGGGRCLDVIECPRKGYNAAYLKAVVHSAKVYVRPLQRNLSIEESPTVEDEYLDVPKEKCINCDEMVLVAELKEHIISCNKSTTNTDIYTEEDTFQFDDSMVQDYLDPVLDVALYESSAAENNDDTSNEQLSIEQIIEQLGRQIKEETFEMVVSRSTVLDNALRRLIKPTFDPKKKLKVVFDSEAGYDTGGLMREFFHLVSDTISQQYMDVSGCFQRNVIAYQEQVYYRCGILISMAFVHGGAPVKLFGPSVYKYLCGDDPSSITVEITEVSDHTLRSLLQQIESTNDASFLKDLLNSNASVLLDNGYNKPICNITLCDKQSIIQTVALNQVIISSLAELSQLRSGLSVLGVGDMMKKYPTVLAPFFCLVEKENLTADMVRKLFTVIRYAPEGSNERQKQVKAYMYFIDYLDDLEKVQETDSSSDSELAKKVKLEQVLSFFTGAVSIPPRGYHSVTLSFNEANSYPTASTCGVELTLPTKYDKYTAFKESLDTGFEMHGGFGLA